MHYFSLSPKLTFLTIQILWMLVVIPRRAAKTDAVLSVHCNWYIVCCLDNPFHLSPLTFVSALHDSCSKLVQIAFNSNTLMLGIPHKDKQKPSSPFFAHTTGYYNSFYCETPRSWNNLPNIAAQASSFRSFKRAHLSYFNSILFSSVCFGYMSQISPLQLFTHPMFVRELS